jgi:hypothetical protein
MKKAFQLLCLIVAPSVAAAQGTAVGPAHAPAAGFTVTLTVPSFVAADVRPAEGAAGSSGYAPSAFVPGASGDAVVSVACNLAGDGSFVRRLVVGGGAGQLVHASRGGSRRKSNEIRRVVAEAEVPLEAASGWRTVLESIGRTSSGMARTAARTAGRIGTPELVIYEVGSF